MNLKDPIVIENHIVYAATTFIIPYTIQKCVIYQRNAPFVMETIPKIIKDLKNVRNIKTNFSLNKNLTKHRRNHRFKINLRVKPSYD